MFKERIYKIWKQFTTVPPRLDASPALCSKNEYTKSESNSQRLSRSKPRTFNCVQRTNIQNLKAIHNGEVKHTILLSLCSKNEYTKSESNSQPLDIAEQTSKNCVQRTNIQNLKAIHNLCSSPYLASRIVFKERIYKIWKQFTTYAVALILLLVLCSKNEYTKSESNSQLIRLFVVWGTYCVQRTNIQNLKAIHNCTSSVHRYRWLCSKNEYTKSESNSQRGLLNNEEAINCVQRTNIQNLKAIHNRINHYVTWTEKSCHCTGQYFGKNIPY